MQDNAVEAREVSCFVIGPIGDKDAPPNSDARVAYEDAVEVLEEVIEPACQEFGITPRRSDHIAHPGEIPEQVYRELRDAYLVIADLTGGNANVLYELGLRHTTGKLTIQIGERGRLPFDVAAIRTIFFRRTAAGLVEARRRLVAAIADSLSRGGDPVTATRVWFEATVLPTAVNHDSMATAPDAVDGDEPGFLEKLAEASEAIASLSRNLDAMTAVIHEITTLVNESADQLNHVNAAGGDVGARVVVTNTLAERLEDPASRLEVLVGDYSQSITRLHPGMIYALSEVTKRPDDNDVKVFREQVGSFIHAADRAWPSLQSFRQALLTTGEATRLLRRVNTRIATALERQLKTADTFNEWRNLL